MSNSGLLKCLDLKTSPCKAQGTPGLDESSFGCHVCVTGNSGASQGELVPSTGQAARPEGVAAQGALGAVTNSPVAGGLTFAFLAFSTESLCETELQRALLWKAGPHGSARKAKA